MRFRLGGVYTGADGRAPTVTDGSVAAVASVENMLGGSGAVGIEIPVGTKSAGGLSRARTGAVYVGGLDGRAICTEPSTRGVGPLYVNEGALGATGGVAEVLKSDGGDVNVREGPKYEGAAGRSPTVTSERTMFSSACRFLA